MKNLVILILVIYSKLCSSQTINYSYDQFGNRTERKIVIIIDPHRTVQDSSDAIVEQMQLAMKSGISVYPNPSESVINITISSLDNENSAIVKLYDLQGKLILTQEQFKKQDIIDITNIKGGVYFLEIVNKDDHLNYKIIKSE